MRVSLVWVKPDGRQQEIALRKAVHVVGRSTECQIRIPNPSISRQHCEFVVSDDDVIVRDLGSSNGTFVNRRKISQATISPGDLVCMGELVFAVRINGNPGDIDAEEAYDEGHVAAPTAAAASMKPAQARPQTPKASPAPSSRLLDSDGSSVGDFDFLSEDDDMKKQPKL